MQNEAQNLREGLAPLARSGKCILYYHQYSSRHARRIRAESPAGLNTPGLRTGGDRMQFFSKVFEIHCGLSTTLRSMSCPFKFTTAGSVLCDGFRYNNVSADLHRQSISIASMTGESAKYPAVFAGSAAIDDRSIAHLACVAVRPQ